jgi:hypothetical protein
MANQRRVSDGVKMAGMAKIWIITRTGWEYDDSRYYRPESSGNTPVSAFTFPGLAKKFCDEKNLEEFRDLGSRGISEYVDYYDIDDEMREFCKNHNLDESLEFTIPSEDISDECAIQIMEKFDLNFYEVVQVDLLA